MEAGEALMSVFLVLIPISLTLAIAFVFLCLASIRDGQFDDLESPRWRILFEDAPEAVPAVAPEAILKSPRAIAPSATFLQPAQPAILARDIDDQG
jgi:cbb3-type cytochrome oxidase maturation protein